MRRMLLVDFGATRLKFGVWDGSDFCMLQSIPAPVPDINEDNKYETNPIKYWDILENICNDRQITDIVLCTEMHGFIPVTDYVGNYISWQDHRGSELVPALNKYTEEFKEKTGMIFKPGLPVVNLLAMENPGIKKIYTLADWLLFHGGSPEPHRINQTLAMSTGIHGVADPKYYSKIISDPYEKLGTITIGNRPINLYGGFGDLQTAVYGAGFPSKGEFIINFGTGSQILTVYDVPDWEWRYSIDGAKYSARTHIPCGRALNAFTQIVPSLFHDLHTLDVQTVLNSDLDINLAVFDSAYGYSNDQKGVISNINEINLSQDNLSASIIRNWLWQYAKLILDVSDTQLTDRILVSGRMGDIPLIRQVLSIITGMEVYQDTDGTEDTLRGLLKIAQQIYRANLARTSNS